MILLADTFAGKYKLSEAEENEYSELLEIEAEVHDWEVDTLKAAEETLKNLREESATGPDGIPAEFWITVGSSTEGLNILLSLCNACLRTRSIPEEWKRSTVASKKKARLSSMSRAFLLPTS